MSIAGVENILQISAPGQCVDGIFLPVAAPAANHITGCLRQGVYKRSENVQVAFAWSTTKDCAGCTLTATAPA